MADTTQLAVVADKVTAYLDKVGAKLGLAAGKVWPWLVKQQALEGISMFIMTMVFFVVLLVFTLKTVKWFSVSALRKRDESSDDHKDRENSIYIRRTVYTIIACLALIIFVVGAVNCIQAGWMQIVNPEYYALMDILQAVQQ